MKLHIVRLSKLKYDNTIILLNKTSQEAKRHQQHNYTRVIIIMQVHIPYSIFQPFFLYFQVYVRSHAIGIFSFSVEIVFRIANTIKSFSKIVYFSNFNITNTIKYSANNTTIILL